MPDNYMQVACWHLAAAKRGSWVERFSVRVLGLRVMGPGVRGSEFRCWGVRTRAAVDLPHVHLRTRETWLVSESLSCRFLKDLSSLCSWQENGRPRAPLKHPHTLHLLQRVDLDAWRPGNLKISGTPTLLKFMQEKVPEAKPQSSCHSPGC